jgi:hypothetical protein
MSGAEIAGLRCGGNQDALGSWRLQNERQLVDRWYLVARLNGCIKLLT